MGGVTLRIVEFNPIRPLYLNRIDLIRFAVEGLLEGGVYSFSDGVLRVFPNPGGTAPVRAGLAGSA